MQKPLMTKTVLFPAKPPGLAAYFGLTIVTSSAIAAAFVYYFLPSQLPEATAIKIVPDTIETSVTALGHIEPQAKVIHLSAPTLAQTARVEQLLVKVGDSVKAGQIVAILDSRDRLQAVLERTKTQVHLARTRLAHLEAGVNPETLIASKAAIARLQAELQGQMTLPEASIDHIRAEHHNAQTECSRYQTLYQAGAISAAERDKICLQAITFGEQLAQQQANRDRSAATLRQHLSEQQATLSQMTAVRPVDIALAEAELAQAQANVRQSQAELALAYVRALQNGQILKIHAYPGEIISDQGIVEIGQPEPRVAIAEVSAMDITKVQIGQPAKLETPSLRDALQGTVSAISWQTSTKEALTPNSAAKVNPRVVEVKILLDRASVQKVQSLTHLPVNVIIDVTSLSVKRKTC